MKNLTAHYNIYFNAKETLAQSEFTIRSAYDDDFNQLLPIFPIPDEQTSSNESQHLNDVIQKANTIALEKYESNWLDDAYLLLARAEYLKGDFYNAVEYFSYVGITFPKEKKNKVAAYLGEAKSDIALENYKDADSLMVKVQKLNDKYFKDQTEALKAELALHVGDVKSAIKFLGNAVNATHDSYRRIRWRYILAQLLEKDHQENKAYENYTKIVKSNASFEMSFNANLSRVRISEAKQGKDFDKIATLTRLLKEDKNKEFKEQIYYQIAQAYADKSDLKNAIKYYQISAHTVPGTVKQKGLSFLKLAELNFDQLKDYQQAQLYYDSTLQYLPKTYPDYKNIAVKANNLQYLADRLTLIDKEKKSLALADLSDAEINAKFEALYKEKERALIEVQQNQSLSSQSSSFNNFNSNDKTNQSSGGGFYFYNSTALSQGLAAFKTRWGNRKLTDNWRISSGSLGNDANKTANTNTYANSEENVDLKTLEAKKDSLKAAYLKTIPYSPEAKKAAKTKIAKALYEIAIFYKDVLKDSDLAVATFEQLVSNYPNEIEAANVYYQLYRLTENTNQTKAAEFKNQLIAQFPNSVYAKTLVEPNFGKEEEVLDAKISDAYQGLYVLYQNKKYQIVLDSMEQLKVKLGSFKKMAPQFDYLKALAIGNTQKVPEFLASLDKIVSTYPDDHLVTPRVKQQIDYIAAHRGMFDTRPTALVDKDGHEVAQEPNVTYTIPKAEPKPIKEEVMIPVPEKKEEAKEIAPLKPEEKKVEPVVQAPKPEEKKDEPAKINFSKNTNQKYFVVIDITDPKQNIAAPFSKLSQFVYGKYDPSAIKLLIRVVSNSDKLIIVSGEYYAKSDAEKLLSDITEQLPKIMEGQSAQYVKFVVSEDNLKLLTNREAINQYLKSFSGKK
ncbi:MAG: tetratricopeptide repeat protein [Sphingobacteriales bacterium]|nr:tetratricopeptide repeat protein [Sphingobacteriales bacterium]